MLVDNIESSNFVQKLPKMSKKVEQIDESRLQHNPFAQPLVIEVNKMLDPIAKIKDENGMEWSANMLMEREKYTKVFHKGGAANRALDLSAGAIRMYVYIIHKMESSKDWIRITPDNYSAKAERSSLNTYKRAINELVENLYITPTIYKHVYWLNPAVFFCGSRVEKYKDKVKIIDTYIGKIKK